MATELYSEGRIIEGCRKGEREFQEMLYRQYARKMYGICLSYAGSRPLAQDMLQEAFIKIFKNIGNFKSEGSFEGWIRKIVVNTSIDMLRQSGKEQFIVEEYPDMEISTGNDALPELQLKDLMEFIARLPKGARMVFNLFAVEGYTHREIAQELNISEGTSKSQFNRARQLLRDWLGEKGN
ncbi:MAG: RNA polymerase sigma factor [Bacteroidales bacterium]|nr:RNA polymerase sigma factor [Bacteroidales bacterium]